MDERSRDASSAARTGDDAVEQLLRLAGPRAVVEAERRERVRRQVQAAWRDSVRARNRQRHLVLGGMALAAAATLIVILRLPHAAPAPPATIVAARLTNATGDVWESSGGARVRLSRGALVTAGSTIEASDESAAAFALEGGGDLRVQGGTTLRVLDVRHVALQRGIVYADSGVASGERAVRIETFAGVVRDIGTRFEVRVMGGELRVRVREGAVRLERGEARYDASAGRELTADASGFVRIASADTFGADWNWIVRAAPFDVEGARLDRFLQWAEREGGREIAFGDPRVEARVADTVLHGSIAGLTVDEALTVVLPTCGLTHRTEGARVVVDAAQSR